MIQTEHPVDDGYIPLINRPDTVRGVVVTFIVSTDAETFFWLSLAYNHQAIACIAVGLRLYVRLRDRLWGWDDLFVFLAAVSVIIHRA
jgi:hypothetical protein